MQYNQHNHTGTFLYLIKVKTVLLPLFQLLPIISFLAPPLLKSCTLAYHQPTVLYCTEMQLVVWGVSSYKVHEYTLQQLATVVDCTHRCRNTHPGNTHISKFRIWSLFTNLVTSFSEQWHMRHGSQSSFGS